MFHSLGGTTVAIYFPQEDLCNLPYVMTSVSLVYLSAYNLPYEIAGVNQVYLSVCNLPHMTGVSQDYLYVCDFPYVMTGVIFTCLYVTSLI